jgi:hypothetical protein
METKIRLRLFFALLALNPAFSFANDHQICYQKPPIPGFTTITGQFLCRTDGTSTPGCQVTGVTGAATFFHSPQGASDDAEATFTAPGTYVGSISFNDGTTRTCTLEIQNVGLKPDYGQQNPGVLSFTTDASGLVTTGIWTATSFASTDLSQSIVAPPDFVAVGGGFTGAVAPTPVLMLSSEQYDASTFGYRQWGVNGAGTSPGTSSSVTGFVIGLKIEGVTVTQLQQWVARTNPAPSYPPVARPSMTQTISVTYPQSTVAIGGGGHTGPTGQFLTTSAPRTWQQCFANSTCEELVSGWIVSSITTAPRLNKHSQPSPGQVYTQLTTLPKILTIGTQTFHVETWVLSANSAATLQPTASVTLPIDYALTSIGATATSSGFLPAGGGFIWSLTPIQGGASASGIVLPFARPGVISAFAVGMKLIAGPIPPLQPLNLNKLPGAGKVLTKPPPKTP